MREIICAKCGVTVVTNRRNARYCSERCSQSSHYQRQHLRTIVCALTSCPAIIHAQNPRQMYCSRHCRNLDKRRDGKCADCQLPAVDGVRWCAEHKKRKSAWGKNRLRQLRVEIIAHYGGACACCGENQYEFLAVDHINNDGAAQRKQAVTQGTTFLYHVRKTWPDDLQILCHNCNMAKGFYGICPHRKMIRLVA